jgi:glycosyltransferase involved in cell wall biosynthesis
MPHKGIDVLINAMPQDMELKVVGSVHDQRYFSLLQDISKHRRVSFHTAATDEDITEAYRSALVTVLPSVYHDVYGHEHRLPELLGLVLLESMACGTPVICTAVGGMPEIVEENVTGFVVPPNDSIALRDRITWLREHPEARKTMSAHCVCLVNERFTWRHVARRCLDGYQI